MICLLFPNKDTCWFCGEWLHIEVPGGLLGPNDNRYCSQDCIEELTEREAQTKVNDWCSSCGFDRHEHAEDCAVAR